MVKKIDCQIWSVLLKWTAVILRVAGVKFLPSRSSFNDWRTSNHEKQPNRKAPLTCIASLSCFAGTTCLIALLSDKDLTVANVGDSRGVLCDKDGNAIPLSHDHKPYQLKERKRIKRAGEFVNASKDFVPSCSSGQGGLLGEPLGEKMFLYPVMSRSVQRLLLRQLGLDFVTFPIKWVATEFALLCGHRLQKSQKKKPLV